MKHWIALLSWLTGALLTYAASPAAKGGQPDEFFGLTNVWALHLTLRPEDWRALEPAESLLHPNRGALPPPEREEFQPDRNRERAPQLQRRNREDEPAQNSRPPAPEGEPRGPGFGGPRGPGGPGGPGPRRLEFPWATASVSFAGEVFTNVGIRFKGNSSFNRARQSYKKPLKLDFDRHVPGRTFFGLEELFLNNNPNEAAHVREALAYDAFRRAGLPASRTAFVQVYLTLTGEFEDRYLGLYTAAEPVENDYLDRHFSHHKGLLVKPEQVRGLDYLGRDWHAYTNRYEVRSHFKPSDMESLVALTRFVQHSTDAEFNSGLDRYFNVDATLRFIALNALLVNMDSFLGTGHNYYLFFDRKEPKGQFIPWDLNEAFGAHPMAGTPSAQAALSILHPGAPGNVFITRLLANDAIALRYRAQVESLLTNAFNAQRLIVDAQRIVRATEAAVQKEPVNSPRGGPGFGPRPRGPRPGGPPPEGPPPGMEGGPFRGPGGPDPQSAMPLEDWIRLREKNVREELAGNRKGTLPQMGRPIPPPRDRQDR